MRLDDRLRDGDFKSVREECEFSSNEIREADLRPRHFRSDERYAVDGKPERHFTRDICFAFASAITLRFTKRRSPVFNATYLEVSETARLDLFLASST